MKDFYINKNSDVEVRYGVAKHAVENLNMPYYNGVKDQCEQLLAITEVIKSLKSSLTKNYLGLAVELNKIVSLGLYKPFNDNYYKFITNEYGISKTTTYNLLEILARFCSNNQLLPKFTDYTYTKLSLILKLSDEDIDKHIAPNMTCSMIRAKLKELKLDKPQDSTDDSTDEHTVDDERSIPMAYDPKKRYDFEYVRNRSKNELINMFMELQRVHFGKGK